MAGDLLICVATAHEDRLLRDAMGGDRSVVAGRHVRLLRTGVGLIKAAYALTYALVTEPAGQVVVYGVGGAYPGSGLETGDVACASSEQFADFGSETPTGFLHAADLGFADRALRVDLDLCERRVPFVTCATCTGTDATARAIVARTGGAIESMEGAAIIEVARTFGVPCGEIRGISNPVGNRDRDAWNIQGAAEAAQRALLAWIETC